MRHSIGRTGLWWVAAAVVSTAIAACGFHLRGAAALPFDSIYIAQATPTLVELSRYVRATSNAKVVEDPKSAEAIFAVLGETREKIILSFNTAGRVREYQLIYRFSFRVHDGKGGQYIPPREILLRRDVAFNDQVLATENQEVLLYREMQSDLVQQVLRQLRAAKLRRPDSEA